MKCRNRIAHHHFLHLVNFKDLLLEVTVSCVTALVVPARLAIKWTEGASYIYNFSWLPPPTVSSDVRWTPKKLTDNQCFGWHYRYSFSHFITIKEKSGQKNDWKSWCMNDLCLSYPMSSDVNERCSYFQACLQLWDLDFDKKINVINWAE